MDTPNTAPLAGVRILDLSRLLPGDHTDQILREAGYSEPDVASLIGRGIAL
ncbi:hypothetical protein FOC84_21970 [Achromobacter pestifer]|uniref:CoA transferase n=1 Tax=Achromobacter pestifer TaxID=1353889 RepID=A0A7D4E2S1_9BURK|nr:hypothetical protein [Achromobacter pestifer]QKH37454.1 hypothetical protein FOC84_21970 [Achromobacter pestifer]